MDRRLHKTSSAKRARFFCFDTLRLLLRGYSQASSFSIARFVGSIDLQRISVPQLPAHGLGSRDPSSGRAEKLTPIDELKLCA